MCSSDLDPKAWAKLINVMKVLNQTPADQLEAALNPIFDVEGALKFLALDISLINNDGFWIRASDYMIFLDDKDKVHVLPWDANETFAIPGGPGFNGNVAGVELSPLFIADSPNRALAQKLLAVPALRAKYLGYVREIADKHLDWAKASPAIEKYRALIRDDMKTDTRNISTYEEFEKSVSEDIQSEGGFMPGPSRTISLKNFYDQRRAYLLKNTPAR